MTIAGYVPAPGERDLSKIVRGIRNLYENAPDSASVTSSAQSEIAASAVRYDTAQTLTSGQQTQARTNISAAPAITTLANSLGADVALNNTANYFDGPSVAQGTTGTWLASGTVTLVDTAGVAAFIAKLWDGTTVIASARNTSTAASNPTTISLSGVITSPAGNIRISVRDTASTSGSIAFNNSGNSKDSTLTAVRIA